jgi:hypothetical protein
MSRKPVILQLDAIDCMLLASSLRLGRLIRSSPFFRVVLGVVTGEPNTPAIDAREAKLEKLLDEGAIEASKANPS